MKTSNTKNSIEDLLKGYKEKFNKYQNAEVSCAVIDQSGTGKSFDLPGCGTEKFPTEHYVDRMGLKFFDILILVTANRFYENDLFLINEATKLNKPIYIVRT